MRSFEVDIAHENSVLQIEHPRNRTGKGPADPQHHSTVVYAANTGCNCQRVADKSGSRNSSAGYAGLG